MRDRIVGALETGCRRGEMLLIKNRHVQWDTCQIRIPAEHAKDGESRRIPFSRNGRLAELLERRRFLGPDAFVFGTPNGEFQSDFRTAWETLVLSAAGKGTERAKRGGRVNREALQAVDVHWHDLRHEAAAAGWPLVSICERSTPTRPRGSQDDPTLSERDRCRTVEGDERETVEG